MATLATGPSPAFQPGDRVWVKMEPYDWWPARVLSTEEMQERGIERQPQHNLTVLFYSGEVTEESFESFNVATANITYFETSSEKAVTTDPDRREAVRRAAADSMANPIKYDLAPGKLMTSVAGAAEPSNRMSGLGDRRKTSDAVKRPREGDDWDTVGDARGAANRRNPVGIDLTSDQCRALASEIQTAVDAEDVPSLRAALCKLDSVFVYREQLKSTKIGVAVGNILGKASLSKLWPLARAVIASWARALPKETFDAIKRHHDLRLSKETITAAAPGDIEMGAASPTMAGGVARSFGPTERGPERESTLRFFSIVRRLLDNPSDPQFHGVTPEHLDRVSQQLAAEITAPDDRKLLLQYLMKPGMSQLRYDLVSGAIGGKQFLAMPASALQTADEKRLEEERITRKLDEQERAKMAFLSVTSLFKCPSCEKNNCTFYEQQTRSADEPTTKFITCLECKFTWTTE